MKSGKKSFSKPKEKIKTIKIKDKITKNEVKKTLLTQLTKTKVTAMNIKTPIFIQQQSSRLTPTNVNTKKRQQKNKPTRLDVKKLYIKRENKKQILTYGADLYQSSQQLQSNLISSKYLQRHEISSKSRSKMIDWLMEVCYVYESDSQTFFLSVDIIDHYFSKSLTILKDIDIHLIGICSIYIASKMEDLFPLRMYNLKHQIGHDKFTEHQIKGKELEILQTISFDIIRVTTYDFILTYLYDFLLNNEEQCQKLKLEKCLEIFENICVFLAKMMTLDEKFTSINTSLKAICSIIAAFDIIRSNSKKITTEMETFLKEWILFIIDESSFAPDDISIVYKMLIGLYTDFEKNCNKKSNLCKTHELYFC